MNWKKEKVFHFSIMTAYLEEDGDFLIRSLSTR